MDTIFEHHDVLQHILALATDGAFILGATRRDTPILTHTIAHLRATCRAARKLIPAPTKLTPNQLFIEGAKNGNIDLCNLAEKYGSKDYGVALRNAVIRGYNDIIDLIFAKELLTTGIIIPPLPLKKAAQYHHLDICIKMIKYNMDSIPNYYMSWGAAKGGHMDIIEWTKQQYGLNYDALLYGAISGNHVEICDMALKSGQVHIYCITPRIGEKNSVKKCACLRDCIKRHGLTSSDFYMQFMLSAAFPKHEHIINLIHQWAIEDKCPIDYSQLLSELINMMIDKENPYFDRHDKHICETIHGFSKQDNQYIDYDDLIEAIDSHTFCTINTIKQWAKESDYEITIDIDDTDIDNSDEDEFINNSEEESYYKIRTWDDLLDTNVKFLRQTIPKMYYSTRFHEHYVAGINGLEDDLIRIHQEYKIFAYDGQDNKTSPNGQRGYLEFVCLPEQGNNLIPELLKNEKIYTLARRFTKTNGMTLYKNIPKSVQLAPNKICWQSEYAGVQSVAEMDAGYYPNIQALFRKCYHVFITFREFPQSADDPEITSILLDILQESCNKK